MNATAVAERAVEPMLDYWTALLWKRLMGTRVLSASVGGSGGNVRNLLVFAHCSQRTVGGLSLVFINTDSSANTIIVLSGGLVGGPQERYMLSAVGGDPHGIALNGSPLKIAGGWGEWSMPSLGGTPAPAGAPLTIAAGTYAFVEFATAGASACA